MSNNSMTEYILGDIVNLLPLKEFGDVTKKYIKAKIISPFDNHVINFKLNNSNEINMGIIQGYQVEILEENISSFGKIFCITPSEIIGFYNNDEHLNTIISWNDCVFKPKDRRIN